MSYDLDKTAEETRERLDRKLDQVADGLGPSRLRTKRARAMCWAGCSGNAYARAVCVICGVGLCKRHTKMHEGKTYCKQHVPGYEL